MANEINDMDHDENCTAIHFPNGSCSCGGKKTPKPGSPEAVIANLREAAATMEMHRFELPEQACQDAIDLIERMAKDGEVNVVMLRQTDAKLAHCTNHLAQIYSLLYPADIKVRDSYYRFESADASEILRILSDKIRAIPETTKKANGA